MGANIVDNATGKPYLKPYEIINRDGVKIAILGMITPAIPSWLPEKLWSGLHFEDMQASAAHWVDIIRKKENPDVLIGLFHAGKSGKRTWQCGGKILLWTLLKKCPALISC